jgi:hypothetical protein
MAKFIKYEKALLEIESHSILAESAELGVETSLTPIENITGSVMRYAADAPLKGTLSFSHYLTGSLHEFLNPLTNVERTGEPLRGNLGGIEFASGYIRSLQFSVSPMAPILVRSSMDIYGELSVLGAEGRSDEVMRGVQDDPRAISHGAQTYLAGNDFGINNKLGFSYSVTCERNPMTVIGSGLPSRVTKENVQISMTVRGEDLGNVLTTTGYAAIADIYVYGVYAEPGSEAMGRFGCTGQVHSQDIAVSNGDYMAGEISLSQDYLTGKQTV